MDTNSSISPPDLYITQAHSHSSNDSSPGQTSTSSSQCSIDSRLNTMSRTSSSSTLCTAYEEYNPPVKVVDDRPAYYDLHIRWCKGPFTEQQDNLPTSVSLDSFLASPTSPSYSRSALEAANYSWPSQSALQKTTSNQDTIDWLSKLAESSLQIQGEALLFLQSDQDPRMRELQE